MAVHLAAGGPAHACRWTRSFRCSKGVSTHRVSTHSPLIAAAPGATILELDDSGFHEVAWEDLALVDRWRRFKRMTPQRYQPGIGLRPGGERPDLEPLVATLYRGMYRAIADHSRLGVNVVADATHHEHYSTPLGILSTCAQQLRDLPVLFVAVRCRIDVVWERRRATWGGTGYAESKTVADPVDLWQRAVEAIEAERRARTVASGATLARARWTGWTPLPGRTPTAEQFVDILSSGPPGGR